MTYIFGLAGLRPTAKAVEAVSCPPYDVIKPGTKLERLLSDNPVSLFHVVLGAHPLEALNKLVEEENLIQDEEPSYYVYEQQYEGLRRLGVILSVEVTDYQKKEIIRHEKTFEEKVKGRIGLMEQTGYVTEPVWLLTKAEITRVLEDVVSEDQPLYAFRSDFQGASELHNIDNRVFKVLEDSEKGQALKALINQGPLYIADGHHRYHSALRMGLNRCIAYVCEASQAKIQAYNRVIRGRRSFESIMGQLDLVPTSQFKTPEKHQAAIYSQEGTYLLKLPSSSTDPVGRLDCYQLEKILYPLLELNHAMINDHQFFDYFPERDLLEMQEQVDQGHYDIAVALHPVDSDELMAVAEAGIDNPEIVMPEKSTFFAPKILSGLFLIPTQFNEEVI